DERKWIAAHVQRIAARAHRVGETLIRPAHRPDRKLAGHAQLDSADRGGQHQRGRMMMVGKRTFPLFASPPIRARPLPLANRPPAVRRTGARTVAREGAIATPPALNARYVNSISAMLPKRWRAAWAVIS